MIPECQQRGQEIVPGWFICRSNRLILSKPGLASRATCERCPFTESENLPGMAATIGVGIAEHKAFDPCVYRGEKIEDKTADLCGLRGVQFEVRACHHYDVPGRCVATRICQRQEEMPCSTCERREMPDDLETVP